jgi:3-dehydroquinate synthetase
MGDLSKALECYGLPTRCDFSAKELAATALHDKKRSGGPLPLVIPKRTGQAELRDIPVEQLEGFIAKGLDE